MDERPKWRENEFLNVFQYREGLNALAVNVEKTVNLKACLVFNLHT